MKGDSLKVLASILALTAILVSFVLAILGMIGAVKFSDGCFLRYTNDGTNFMADHITNTVTLNANGNYNTMTNIAFDAYKVDLDSNHYGRWLNTNLVVVPDQEIKFKITGEVSLCRAYIPKNNLQFAERDRPNSNLDNNKHKIAIPRIEDVHIEPISLTFDAKTDEWRNITELFVNDHVIVSLSPNHKPETNVSTNINSILNVFTNSLESGDCGEGKRIYSPICGRYSIYSGQYVKSCKLAKDYYNCNKTSTWQCKTLLNTLACNKAPSRLTCLGCEKKHECKKCAAWVNVYGIAPEPYRDDGSVTSPWYDNLGKLYTNFQPQCSHNVNILPSNKCPDVDRSVKDKDYIMGDYQNKRYFWYSADNATGLLYRFDNNEIPTNAKSLGSNSQFASIVTDQTPYEYHNHKYKIIYNDILINIPKTYLQYRFWNKDNQFANNTGGYVLNIKHTKCRRTNGKSLSDVIQNRGRVEYMIIPFGEDPNNNGTVHSASGIDDVDAEGNAVIKSNNNGYLWMRIFNNQEDYKDSSGRYKVQFFTTETVGNFTINIINPLFEQLKGKIKYVAAMIFKNMTCYGGNPNNHNQISSCTNFFLYIKAMLIFYIMTYGVMFIFGIIKISQTDLMIRMIKIIIVSGLINGNSFEFFNKYIFDLVTDFSDELISNMSGYSLFSSNSKIANPFMFLDTIMSKIFFSKTFIVQILALFSMGLSGLLYFVLIFIATVILIITIFRTIAIYIMAFMATSILIGLAPLFLTFVLFDVTRYLFDNWVRFTIKYMIEPVILMAGIIVLTQLFTIYLDFVTGYSVCWKCAVPIKIPFPNIPGLPAILSNVEIFCINWFAPWGMDYRVGTMGINMQHIIGLMIIAYGMYGYVEFSGQMVTKLTSTAGPLATSMGQVMSSSIEDDALSKIGLDQASIKQIKHSATKRLLTRNTIFNRARKNWKE